MTVTAASHQLAAIAFPLNGQSPIDANVVRGNDNTIRGTYNVHDADATIHWQSGLLANRPAFGTVGQTYLTTDVAGIHLFYDTGSAWSVLNYVPSTGGTITGAVAITDTTDATSISTGSVTTLGGVGITKALWVGGLANIAGVLTATGGVTGNVTGNVTGSSGSCTGLAATAAALATPRAINGVNFDGTAAITVTAAAGTLTGTTLAVAVVASSLTTVGALVGGSIPYSLVTGGPPAGVSLGLIIALL